MSSKAQSKQPQTNTSAPPITQSSATAVTTRPHTRWFWQRSLRHRIIVTYGALFLLILVSILIYTGSEIYHVQLEQAEHELEISAFLIANALEDPQSGYPQELKRFGTLEIEDGGDISPSRGTKGWKRDDPDPEEDNSNSATASFLIYTKGANVLATNHFFTATDIAMVDLDSEEAHHFQDFVKAYMRNETEQVTLISVSGVVIADTIREAQAMPNQATQTEVASALNGSEQHEVRTDPESGLLMLYAAAPVQISNQILGVVRLARPMQEVVRPTRRFLLNLTLGGLISLLLMTIIGMGLGQYLVRPLHKLEETARQVAQGDLNQVAPVETGDEVGVLAITFNTMVARLREIIEQQRLFVANASHELRTPLTNIKLRSEALLIMETELSPRVKRYVTEIDWEADRLRRLANTLLNLASIERTAHAPPTETVDIAPTLLEVVRSFRVAARHAELTLIAQIPEPIAPLRVWPDHIVVIVNNLFDNAIKYTTAGGEVHFTVSIVKRTCQIRIEDTGAGIPAEDLPFIFDRFYRVDKARSRQSAIQAGIGSGSGLGLAIVKSLVELNAGTITVESTLGQGTCFVIGFPLA
ncbi:MAG: HAMP domain-containing sensor histidine kinase [Caldilineaceae bacterium]